MVGDYELRRYPARVLRVRRSLFGLGDTLPAPPTAAEAPAVDAAKARDVGQGVFVGTAYGIALGMVVSELVLRQRDAAAQLRQNHQFILLSALFGAAAGGLVAVQSHAVTA